MVNMRENLSPLQPVAALEPVDWMISDKLVDYADALAFMEASGRTSLGAKRPKPCVAGRAPAALYRRHQRA